LLLRRTGIMGGPCREKKLYYSDRYDTDEVVGEGGDRVRCCHASTHTEERCKPKGENQRTWNTAQLFFAREPRRLQRDMWGGGYRGMGAWSKKKGQKKSIRP